MLKLVSFSLGLAILLYAVNAEARGRRCCNNTTACCATQNVCTPSIAASMPTTPAPDAVAQGTRSMSVQPGTPATATFYAPRSYRSPTPSYVLPKTDVRRFNDRFDY